MQISLFFTSKEATEAWQGHFKLTAKLKGHRELLQLQAIWIKNEMTTRSWENFWHADLLKSEPLVLTSFCEENYLDPGWISSLKPEKEVKKNP